MDTAIVPRQRDDVGRQTPFVGIVPRRVSLRRAMLAEYAAGPSFGYRQHTTDLLDRLAATGGLKKSASTPLAGSPCRAQGPRQAASTVRSLAPTPSSAAPDRPSSRHVPCVTDPAFVPISRSGGTLRPQSIPAQPAHRIHEIRDNLLRRKTLTFHNFLQFSRHNRLSRIGPVFRRQTTCIKRGATDAI
jgi:hypothetical protein